jgi:hypothetical protein
VGGALRRGRRIGLRDPQGDGVVGDGDASEGRGKRGRGQKPDEERQRFGQVDVLARGCPKGREGGGEGGLGCSRLGTHEHLGVVGVVDGDVALASNCHPQTGLGAEPRGEGLPHEEVEEGGEWAALSHAGVPQSGRRLHAVDVHRGVGVGQEQPGPGQHALGGAHDLHGLENEASVHRVKSLGDVQVGDGRRGAL